jgi:2-polyprenyl-6-methoxyphenol hydroxylase-like FAD-dependent oxidoreductase
VKNDTQILIAGGGPTGLTLAALLGRFGVDCIVLERDPTTTNHPQAHVVNTRSMEILRSLGLDQAVLAAALPAVASQIRWVTEMSGSELACLNLLADNARALLRLTSSPTVPASCAQDRVEPLLAEKAQSLGAEVRFSHKMVGFSDDGDRVLAQVEGPDGAYELSADYFVGCDGASSRTRKTLGVAMEGIGVLGHVANIYFEADLAEIVADRPAILYWILNAVSPGVMIAMDGRRRWSLHLIFGGEREELEKFTPEVCKRLARAAIGADVAIDIRVVKPWTMTAEVATSYREGRVFLAGDAAHRFPPTGGFGMNTGMQDAHNLAWKFAAVLAGHAGEALLDTFEVERKPVAERNTEWSVANVIGITDIAGPGAAVLAGHIASGELTLEKASEYIQAIADREAGHFDSLALDLGFTYEAGAVVADGSKPTAVLDEYRDFVADGRPGTRLPHVWLERDEQRFSSLDLVEDRYVLFTVPAHAQAWRDAADGREPRMDVFAVGAEVLDVDGIWAATMGIDDGALLVRPDGHIAWRSRDAVADPRETLDQVLAVVLPK